MGPPLIEVLSGPVMEEKERECDDMSAMFNRFKEEPGSPHGQAIQEHFYESDDTDGIILDSLSQDDADERYEMMEALVGALTELSIPYCILAGTLLGVVQSHSLLFHDRGLDIAVVDMDFDDCNFHHFQT